MQRFSGQTLDWTISGKNVFKLNLAGAQKTEHGKLENGRITPVACYSRGGRTLAHAGVQGLLIDVLKKHSQIDKIFSAVRSTLAARYDPHFVETGMNHAMQSLEVMAIDRWVQCSTRKGKPTLKLEVPKDGEHIKTHTSDSVAARPGASAYAGLENADAS